MKLEQIIRIMKREQGIKNIQQGMQIVQYLDKLILKCKKINITDTILIAGTPRSGTSWLMEVFENIPEYTYLFEPLNPIFFPEAFEIGFQSRTYLLPATEWVEGEEYLRKTFTGRIFSHLSPYQTNLRSIMHRLLGNKLIIKSVRLNRLLPWVVKRFKLRGIIFIIRHPCAVIASQFKTGFYGYQAASSPHMDILPNRKMVLDEASKIDGLDSKLLEQLKTIETQEEILAAIWCLDNYVPLSFPKPHPWTTVIYEKVVKDGENEIHRIMEEIGEQTIPQSVVHRLHVPSVLTLGKERKVVKDANAQLAKWKSALTAKQIERILNIVSDFGLGFYTEDIEPDYENIGINH